MGFSEGSINERLTRRPENEGMTKLELAEEEEQELQFKEYQEQLKIKNKKKTLRYQ